MVRNHGQLICAVGPAQTDRVERPGKCLRGEHRGRAIDRRNRGIDDEHDEVLAAGHGGIGFPGRVHLGEAGRLAGDGKRARSLFGEERRDRAESHRERASDEREG